MNVNFVFKVAFFHPGHDEMGTAMEDTMVADTVVKTLHENGIQVCEKGSNNKLVVSIIEDV